MIRTWQVLDTIYRVISDWGFRSWDLCLTAEGIVAVRKGFWYAISAKRVVDTKSQRVMPLVDKGDAAWRRYSIEELECINVQRRIFTQSEIRIKRRGHDVDIYGAAAFEDIMRARQVLKDLYPHLYSEKGYWPKNWWGP